MSSKKSRTRLAGYVLLSKQSCGKCDRLHITHERGQLIIDKSELDEWLAKWPGNSFRIAEVHEILRGNDA